MFTDITTSVKQSLSTDTGKIFTLNVARNMKTISEKRSGLDIYSPRLISIEFDGFPIMESYDHQFVTTVRFGLSFYMFEMQGA